MKKLLSILAAVGLSATTSVSVVACSTPDKKENKEQVDAKAPDKTLSILLQETLRGEKLKENDQKIVQTKILEALTSANQNANSNNQETFVFDLKEVTTITKSIHVEIKETKASTEKQGLKAGELNLQVDFTLPEDKEKVLAKIKEISAEQLIIQGIAAKDIKNLDVQNQLKEKLNLQDHLVALEFKEVPNSFKPIIVNQSSDDLKIQNGELTLNIFFSGEKLIDPETKNDQFQFYFINEDYKSHLEVQIKEVLAKTKENLNINLSDFPINGLGEKPVPLGKFISGWGTTILGFFPKTIPTKFDETDKAWNTWQGNLNLLGSIIDINQELEFELQIPISDTIKGQIVINTKISDLLTSILPDIIHFRNFMSEQKEKNQKENLILLLIQYLFEKPRDINGDGFLNVDKSISSVNNPNDYLTFNTNLERLAQDILQGWQNENDEKLKNKSGQEIKPLSVKLIVPNLLDVTLSYETDVDNEILGIFDLLPIENIKSFINQLLNYDLNSKITLVINLPGIEFSVEIDLGSSIKQGLKNMLNLEETLKDLRLEYLDFDWTKGTLQIEVMNKDGNWRIANDFTADVLQAQDIRVKFVKNSFKIKYADLAFEVDNPSITFNLNLKSIIIK